MRRLLRSAAAVAVAGCLLLCLPLRAAGADPTITAVSPILANANQRITISGTGFGRFRPYIGDSSLIRIRDQSGRWNAGSARDRPFDKVGLAVVSWTDTKIVLGGFRGAYGRFGWRLKPGDRLLIEIWNPQSHAGPALYRTSVAAAF